MKSLMSLYKHMLADASMWCCTSTIRDWETVAKRSENEGLSFFTITLPNLGRDFEKSLDQGYVSHSQFSSFRKTGLLPRFLGGYYDLVFDRVSGRLLNRPSTCAIYFIRQLTLAFKKYGAECTEPRRAKAFRSYVECEREVTQWSENVGDNRLRLFSQTFSRVWSEVLGKVNRDVNNVQHVPKHGPGATADYRVGNRKFDVKHWTSRLEEFFPSADFVIPNYGFTEVLDRVTYLEPAAELPVRVISVPKTLKAPRIIAIEPSYVQYAQQSILELLVWYIERDKRLSNCVGFLDQSPNQRLAKSSSVNGRLATIDLSEASDRVPNLLVTTALKDFPALCGAIQACRSLKASVPGYGIIPLSKHASMGSALCFPIMAMVILTIVVIGWQKTLSRSYTEKDLKLLFRKVRVYGDDIIIPVEIVPSVLAELETYCLKVNIDKSFWTGKFRESCGKDYYCGHDVSPSYVRNSLPSDRRDAQKIVSTMALRNRLYKNGLWSTCRYIDNELGKLAKFPLVAETSSIIGRYSFLGYETNGYSTATQSHLTRGLVVKPRPRPSRLTGPGALMKYFLKRGRKPLPRDSFEQHGRPLAVNIKQRWALPY